MDGRGDRSDDDDDGDGDSPSPWRLVRVIIPSINFIGAASNCLADTAINDLIWGLEVWAASAEVVVAVVDLAGVWFFRRGEFRTCRRP